jgi:hypothetical protein
MAYRIRTAYQSRLMPCRPCKQTHDRVSKCGADRGPRGRTDWATYPALHGGDEVEGGDAAGAAVNEQVLVAGAVLEAQEVIVLEEEVGRPQHHRLVQRRAALHCHRYQTSASGYQNRQVLVDIATDKCQRVSEQSRPRSPLSPPPQEVTASGLTVIGDLVNHPRVERDKVARPDLARREEEPRARAGQCGGEALQAEADVVGDERVQEAVERHPIGLDVRAAVVGHAASAVVDLCQALVQGRELWGREGVRRQGIVARQLEGLEGWWEGTAARRGSRYGVKNGTSVVIRVGYLPSSEV